MRASERRGPSTGFWLAVAGAFAVGAYALSRPSVVGKLQTVADHLNPSLLTRYLALRDKIRTAAQEAGIPPEVLAGTVRVESAYNNQGPRAPECVAAGINCTCSRVLAVGLAQIVRSTAADVGYSGTAQGLCDEMTNLRYAARYLAQLAKKYSDPAKRRPGDDLWTAVRSAYNAGPGNYDRGRIYGGTERYAAKAEATTQDIRNRGLAGLSYFYA